MMEITKIPIAFLINNFGRGGGTENQLASLIEGLDRTRFEPYLIALQPKWEDAVLNLDCKISYLNLNRLVSWKGIMTFLGLASFMRKQRIQIVQIYFFDSRMLGVLAARLAGVKKIVVCRRDNGWGISRKRMALLKWTGRFAHYCLVNANAVKEMVKRTEAFGDRQIEVIYNGVSLSEKTQSVINSRESLGIPESAPIVGMVANLRPVKRIDTFLRVASRVIDKNTHFVIVGYPQLSVEAFKNEADELGLTGRMHFHYTVLDTRDIIELFDVGVLTSASEGLSNVLIEYSLVGVPAVAFNVGGNAEIILDGKTGYVIPDGDEELMAAKINYLMANPEICADFGKAGQINAEDTFRVDTMVRRTQEFYDRILDV